MHKNIKYKTKTLLSKMSVQCRMCAEKIFNPNTKNLFENDDDEILTSVELITGILLREDIHMPNYICSCCHLDLCHAMAFRERCLQTEQLFQQRKLERMKLTVPSSAGCARLASSVSKAVYSDPTIHFETHKYVPPTHKYYKLNAAVAPTPQDRWSNSEKNISSSFEDLNNFSGDEPNNEAPKPQELILDYGDNVEEEEGTEEHATVESNKNKTCSKKDDSNAKLDKYICELCGLQSTSTANHEIHMRRHKGEKNFKCEECGSRHYSKYLMHLHIRVKHKGEKPFACKFCDERFHSGSTRIRHERVRHIRDWAFECKICGKKYLTKSCLNKHQFLHTGLRPYRCDLCNVAFPRRPGLRIHCRTKQHQKRASEAQMNPNDVLNATPITTSETNVANKSISFPDSLMGDLDV